MPEDYYGEDTNSLAVMPAGYAQRAQENMIRAYNQAAQKSFGARGELSKYLDDIDTSTAFNYSPEAAQYLYDAGRYPSENTEYNLTSSVLNRTDPQTGAPLPYTTGQLEQYAQQPLGEQFYANFNPGGENWESGNLQFDPTSQYRLIDRSTGETLYSGTGYEAGKNISNIASKMMDASGNKANWIVETAPAGSDEWSQRYEHKPDATSLMEYALPLATAFIPGLNWIASAALAGGANTAGKLLSNYSLGDALKSGALTALTAGALKAPILGGGGSLAGTVTNAIGNIPVVGDALKALGTTGGSGIDPLTGDIIVNATTAGSAAPLISNVASGLLGSAAFTPNYSGLGQYASPDYADIQQTPTENVYEQTPPETVDPNAIVVTGNTTPLDVSGALDSAASSLLPQIVTNPVTEELAVKPAEKPAEAKPQEQPEATDQNEIVVTGDTTPLDLSNLTGSLASSFVPQVVTNPITNELAVKPAETPTQQEKVEDTFDETFAQPNDIVVTAGPDLSALNNLVSGGLSSLTPSVGASTTPPAEGPLSQETTQKEEPTNEIVVEGNTAKPIEDLLSSVGAVVPPLNTVDIPADAGNVTPKDDKGGLSTLDKLRLAAAAIGALGGGAAGGGGGATLPAGLGRRDPTYSAKLPTPGVNGAFAVGGLGPSTLTAPAGGDWTKFGMGSATRATPTQIPQYGGVNPPGFDTQTWEWLGPQTSVAKNIMDELAVLPSSAAPVEPVNKAMGGYAVGGPGDGRSDEIPAMLSDGEYVIDAETVALLGNGSSKAGAQQLDKFRANIRKHKGRELARGKFSVKAKEPSAYLSGGR